MNKKNQSKTVNKEAFRMLALEIGLNEACRKLDVPIPTGKSWARRGGWQLPKRPGGRPGRTLSASSLNPIADALVATHKELEERTKSGLARATARAAEAAGTAAEPLQVSNPAHLRDLAASAARIFGWDADKKPGVQLNTLVITTEQLQKIRALREQADAQEQSTAANQRKENK
jgi:hypothetical protein